MQNRHVIATVTLIGAVMARSVSAAPTSIFDIDTTLEAAFLELQQRDAHLAIVFGAQWCGVCRKMQSGTFVDPRVGDVKDMIWVKVDIDERPDLAAWFGVRGVPAVVILDKNGVVLGSRVGYMDAERLVEFVEKSLRQSSKVKQLEAAVRVLQSDVDPDLSIDKLAELIEPVVKQLADPQRQARTMTLDAVKQADSAVWHALVIYMEDKRLSMRAAAGQTLGYVTSGELPFDPFADVKQRRKQVAAWKAYVQEKAPRSSAKPQRTGPPPAPR